jgi:hypothetical protein
MTRRGRIVARAVAPVHVRCTVDLPPSFRGFLEGSLLWQGFEKRFDPWRPSEEAFDALFRTLPQNHSVAGGLQILKLLHDLLPHWRRRWNRKTGQFETAYGCELLDTVLAFEIAAAAASLHDLDTKDKRGEVDANLHFEREPLAVFLRVLDVLQEWDRPELRRRMAGAQDDALLCPFQAVIAKSPDTGTSHRASGAVLELWRMLSEQGRRTLGQIGTSLCDEAVPFRAKCEAREIRTSFDGAQSHRLACDCCEREVRNALKSGDQTNEFKGYDYFWQKAVQEMLKERAVKDAKVVTKMMNDIGSKDSLGGTSYQDLLRMFLFVT